MAVRKLLFAMTSIAVVHATKLLVASYPASAAELGAVQTLQLDLSPAGGKPSLQITGTSHDCGSRPSWLDISCDNHTVICVDEGSPGGFTVLSTKPDGGLEKHSNMTTLGGPVSIIRYNNASSLALAHYGPVGAFSTFKLQSNYAYLPLQNATFNVSGSEHDSQKTSHIHQAVLDPTEQYLIFPDLGGNRVYVYCIDPKTSILEEHAPLSFKSKYGPRHAVFWVKEYVTFMFVVHEIANRITSYKVTYLPSGGLNFTEVDDVSTFGNTPPPETAVPAPAAAEIVKTPDNNFIIVSNRRSATLEVPNPDPNNKTNIKSDSLATFRPKNDGTLEFVELTASGGENPRHFSLNKEGTLVAVANTKSVYIWARDTVTGKFNKEPVAAAHDLGPGDLSNVQWLSN